MASVVVRAAATAGAARDYNTNPDLSDRSEEPEERTPQIAIEQLSPARRLMRRTWLLFDDPSSSPQVRPRCGWLTPLFPRPLLPPPPSFLHPPPDAPWSRASTSRANTPRANTCVCARRPNTRRYL